MTNGLRVYICYPSSHSRLLDVFPSEDMMAQLRSGLLKEDTKLQAAADHNASHIVQGASGFHVAKIQAALLLLDDDAEISLTEFVDGFYGKSTADAVLAFKSDRDIINPDYQKTADNIVGKRTMAALDDELSDNAVATRLCDPKERERIGLLINMQRPSAVNMIKTTLNSLAECKEAFELDIINPAKAQQLRRDNSFTIDGLSRFFSVDGSNQSRFLPGIVSNYEKFAAKVSRLAGDQAPVEFMLFLKDFRIDIAHAVPPAKPKQPESSRRIKGKNFVSSIPAAVSGKRSMFFFPPYRLEQGLAPSALAGIQVHEMGHFYFNFIDGDPRGKPTQQCMTITQSYDITARQATFKQLLATK